MITAATHTLRSRPATVSRILRNVPNRKPRKKNSSQIGATAQTNTAVITIAAWLWVSLSSDGSLSLPCRLNTIA